MHGLLKKLDRNQEPKAERVRKSGTRPPAAPRPAKLAKDANGEKVAPAKPRPGAQSSLHASKGHTVDIQ